MTPQAAFDEPVVLPALAVCDRGGLRMEFLVLDVVYVVGILALIAIVALVGKAVEKL